MASTNEIDILYDSDMDIAMATNPSNFTVVSNGVFINLAGATLTYSNRITKLSGLPVLTTNVTVRVVNVEDLAGNAIINDGSNVLNGPIDITAPAGTNVINAGASITGSVNVTLALSAADGGSGMSLASSEMRFSNDGSTWSAPESYGTTKVWTLSAGDGVKTVYVRYKDAAGNWSSANITDTITLDTTAPTGTVIINSGTSSTSSTTVTLTLSAADANSLSQMQFSNDNITYSMAEAYGISKTWTITAGDGTKTVYVKYKDSVGNWSAGITDTIVLDTTGPTGSVVINGGQVSTMLTTVSLTLSGTDTGSGVVSMQISNDGVSWTTYAYAAAKVWSIPAGEGVKTVYVKYIDALGNASGVNATDTIALCLVQYLKVEATPDKVISGDMVTIKVTACLTDSTMSTNYYNSIVYNNTDLNGIPLGSYTFTGTGTRNISNNNVFKTIGRQTITVVDSVIPTITGSVSVKVFDAKLINAATGGLFTSIDGTSMYIPAGALEADTYLGFSVTDNPPEVGTDYKLKKTVSPVCRDYGKLILSPWELNDITFKKAVTITIPYESADVTGLDEKTLRIFYYDGIKGKYEIVPGVQTISGGKVTASVTRFTAYRIIGTYLASNLDDVIGYPSPFNISTAVGGKFKVRNLPVDCTMTVYNIAGEKIRELSEASQSVSNAGWIEWDGKNEIGETVGQGMYVYVIKTADGQKKTGKVGVIK
ncbi:MAG: hypothetical protein A2231_00830 [Candidatus Firestonebacteria bacterium RIFOXYA2_FULL_40_8]|nr:MAG: hypothetical protein A2231_00830 [Candidatus Firestonebacteria bacterium RIFOXYA2_FULL_40_8]